MNRELDRKLAEWVGFEYVEEKIEQMMGGSVEITPSYWLCPNKNNWLLSLPDFTSSLDACFKWLVPDHNIIFVHFGYAADTVTCELELYNGGAFAGFADMGDTAEALALCIAFDKFIDAEEV